MPLLIIGGNSKSMKWRNLVIRKLSAELWIADSWIYAAGKNSYILFAKEKLATWRSRLLSWHGDRDNDSDAVTLWHQQRDTNSRQWQFMQT